MTEPDGKVDRRGFFRTARNAAAVLTAAGVGAEVDSEATGGLLNLDFLKLLGSSALDDSSPTTEQLWNNPASRSSLIVSCLASYGETQTDVQMVAGDKMGLPIEFSDRPNPPSQAYPHRATLRDVRIQDPQNPKNTLELTMVAHHRHPDTSLNVCVFHEKTSNTLLFVCPGYDRSSDVPAVLHTLSGKLDPADSEMASLMRDTMGQIHSNGVKVEHAAVFGHSLGAGPAVEALAHLMHDKEWEDLLGSAKPKAAMLEEWNSKAAAENIASHAGWPDVNALAACTTSVRRIPATLVAQPGNRVLGKTAEAIVPENLGDALVMDQLTARQEGHRETSIAEDLLSHRAKVVATTPDVLDRAPATILTQDFGALAKAGAYEATNASVRLGTGAAMVAGFTGFLKWRGNRIAQNQQRERDSQAR